jgi:hypothetical protein
MAGKDPDVGVQDPGPVEQGMFPKSMDDTVKMVKDRRNAMAEAQGRADQASLDLNRLRNEIDALNAMRSAHGEPPL